MASRSALTWKPSGRAHVLEDALLGARGDDWLRAPLYEDVGPPLGTALVLDRHQSDDAVGAPVLAVAEKDHAVALDVHAASGAPPVRAAWPGPKGVTEPGQYAADHAHG